MVAGVSMIEPIGRRRWNNLKTEKKRVSFRRSLARRFFSSLYFESAWNVIRKCDVIANRLDSKRNYHPNLSASVHIFIRKHQMLVCVSLFILRIAPSEAVISESASASVTASYFRETENPYVTAGWQSESMMKAITTVLSSVFCCCCLY